MKKLLTASLVIALFGLVGCSAQEPKPSSVINHDTISETISNTKANVQVGTHHKQKCKKAVKAVGKLGEEAPKADVAK